MIYTNWYKNNMLEKHEKWIANELVLETIAGSYMYGCETPESDRDVVGIFMPKREHVYPQEYGYILGFDQLPKFNRKELKGKNKRQIVNKQEVEIEWINIIEFFNLCGLKGSPNFIEILFARKHLVTFANDIGHKLRDNRKLFLSMKQYHSFKGYAIGQMNRIKSRKPEDENRRKLIERVGYDCKMGSHVLRLIDNLEQLLTTQELDLMRNKEEVKRMKVGNWGSLERLESEFNRRMDDIGELARKVSLPVQPRSGELHELLKEILDGYFGNKEKKQYEYISCKDVMDKLDSIERKF
jgi:hypothetical protein